MIIKLWDILRNTAGDGGSAGGAGSGAAGTGTGAGASGDGGAGSAGAGGSGASGAGSGTNGSSGDAPAALINPDYTFREGWQNDLPDDQFADLKPTLANFRDLGSLGKALKDNMTKAREKTDGMVKLPVPPAEGAKPEEVEAYKADLAAYHKAIGIPEKPEDYGLKAPEQLPEGTHWQPEVAAEFAKVALELGLTPAQAKKLSEFQLGLTANQYQQNLAALKAYDEQQDATIMKAFGDQADKRMIQAKQACMTLFGSPDLPEDRAQLTIGLAKLADLVSEDKLVSAGATANKLGPGAMAREIQMDPNSPFNNPGHPRHKEQVAQVLELRKRETGEK